MAACNIPYIQNRDRSKSADPQKDLERDIKLHGDVVRAIRKFSLFELHTTSREIDASVAAGSTTTQKKLYKAIVYPKNQDKRDDLRRHFIDTYVDGLPIEDYITFENLHGQSVIGVNIYKNEADPYESFEISNEDNYNLLEQANLIFDEKESYDIFEFLNEPAFAQKLNKLVNEEEGERTKEAERLQALIDDPLTPEGVRQTARKTLNITYKTSAQNVNFASIIKAVAGVREFIKSLGAFNKEGEFDINKNSILARAKALNEQADLSGDYRTKALLRREALKLLDQAKKGMQLFDVLDFIYKEANIKVTTKELFEKFNRYSFTDRILEEFPNEKDKEKIGAALKELFENPGKDITGIRSFNDIVQEITGLEYNKISKIFEYSSYDRPRIVEKLRDEDMLFSALATTSEQVNALSNYIYDEVINTMSGLLYDSQEQRIAETLLRLNDGRTELDPANRALVRTRKQWAESLKNMINETNSFMLYTQTPILSDNLTMSTTAFMLNRIDRDTILERSKILDKIRIEFKGFNGFTKEERKKFDKAMVVGYFDFYSSPYAVDLDEDNGVFNISKDGAIIESFNISDMKLEEGSYYKIEETPAKGEDKIFRDNTYIYVNPRTEEYILVTKSLGIAGLRKDETYDIQKKHFEKSLNYHLAVLRNMQARGDWSDYEIYPEIYLSAFDGSDPKEDKTLIQDLIYAFEQAHMNKLSIDQTDDITKSILDILSSNLDKDLEDALLLDYVEQGSQNPLDMIIEIHEAINTREYTNYYRGFNFEYRKAIVTKRQGKESQDTFLFRMADGSNKSLKVTLDPVTGEDYIFEDEAGNIYQLSDIKFLFKKSNEYINQLDSRQYPAHETLKRNPRYAEYYELVRKNLGMQYNSSDRKDLDFGQIPHIAKTENVFEEEYYDVYCKDENWCTTARLPIAFKQRVLKSRTTDLLKNILLLASEKISFDQRVAMDPFLKYMNAFLYKKKVLGNESDIIYKVKNSDYLDREFPHIYPNIFSEFLDDWKTSGGNNSIQKLKVKLDYISISSKNETIKFLIKILFASKFLFLGSILIFIKDYFLSWGLNTKEQLDYFYDINHGFLFDALNLLYMLMVLGLGAYAFLYFYLRTKKYLSLKLPFILILVFYTFFISPFLNGNPFFNNYYGLEKVYLNPERPDSINEKSYLIEKSQTDYLETKINMLESEEYVDIVRKRGFVFLEAGIMEGYKTPSREYEGFVSYIICLLILALEKVIHTITYFLFPCGTFFAYKHSPRAIIFINKCIQKLKIKQFKNLIIDYIRKNS